MSTITGGSAPSGGPGRVHNYEASRAPGATDDITSGYLPASFWAWPAEDRVWVCIDGTEGAAKWSELAISSQISDGTNTVTAEQARDHIDSTANPHSVTAAQAGADPTGSAAAAQAAVQANLDTHEADVSNPHSVTRAQIGAAADADLTAHEADVANPHSVTAAQAGADPSGTASAAVAAHAATDNAHGLDRQVFTADGTWTKPSAGTIAIVQVWGGGGAGAEDPTNGAGGGGGGYAESVIALSALDATEDVTVGAGGTPGGSDGGESWFGSVPLVRATGGTNASGTTGGAGGGAGEIGLGGGAAGADATGLWGGGGGDRTSAGNAIMGGGGGAASLNGGSSMGGGDGAGGDGVGSIPGGGGGGGDGSFAFARAGGRGEVRVTVI